MSGSRRDAEAATSFEVEMRRFSRYLVGVDPSTHQVQRYGECIEKLGIFPSGRFDRLLMRCAGWRLPGLSCADAYASFFAKTSTLRKRLVVALALLESGPPSCDVIDRPSSPGRLAALTVVGGHAMVTALSLSVGTLLLAPFHVFLRDGRARDHKANP